MSYYIIFMLGFSIVATVILGAFGLYLIITGVAGLIREKMKVHNWLDDVSHVCSGANCPKCEQLRKGG